MSGICGVWRKDDPGRIAASLAAIRSGLSLAAEECNALETAPPAGLAVSARFSGQQIYRNGHIVVACDAELVNESELAEAGGCTTELPAGARTGALLDALYRRFGCDFVDKLQGGFAVILWDGRERRFIAAIDGFGIKRLAYYEDQNVVLVASRVDALVRSGDIDTAINPKAVANILNFTSNLGPETIFTAVHRLIPGAMLVASDRNMEVRKYWDMRYTEGRGSSKSRLSRELESVMESSVAAQCRNLPFTELGAFLSGGTDSSTVVGILTRLAQRPVKAFSIGFEEERFNELGYARLAARKFGSEHYTYLVGPRDCFEALPHTVRYFDEPYGNSSAIPTYFCARLAAQNGVKTLLAGDGGDELFGGNERYATDKVFQVYHFLPGWLRRRLIEPALALAPGSSGVLSRARAYVRRANMPGVERMLSYQFLRTHSPVEVFEDGWLSALGGYSVLDIPAGHYSSAGAGDHLNRLLYVDVKITLADNDLPKVTCMSELAGVQIRFPFLGRSVAEFSGRIPARWKVKGFNKRYLFKRAFREVLPREIINKKKHGFGIPVARWLKSDPHLRELSQDTLLSASAFSRGYFRRQFIEEMFRNHDADDSTYYGDTIWTLLTMELWHRQVIGTGATVAK